jgi:glutathione S-transferase
MQGNSMIGQTTDEARAEYAAGELLKKLQVYETLLGKHKYLAGDVRIYSLFQILIQI